ncbi:MAG: Acyl-CoA thioester hydrolase YbgC [Syntrophorhabdus sp. PtaU1.Bin058]|nr:MAG: Acyl-CoA thioester hydrolase YbgC [Syntrophorhabdus sp. PtaU1.Bin058]
MNVCIQPVKRISYNIIRGHWFCYSFPTQQRAPDIHYIDRRQGKCYEKDMYTTRIYYQDTDAGGVVYFANYLKFFEKSWFEHLLSIGVSIPEWEKNGTYLIVKTVSLDLMEKLLYGDMISVKTSIKEVKNAYFILEHSVFKDNRATAKGQTTMVCIDAKGKPKRMPEAFRINLLQSMKG